jgi:iron complex outermembrane receptor protein
MATGTPTAGQIAISPLNTTADLKFSYQFNESRTGWLGDTVSAIDVRNVLNRATPFVNNPLGIGYDPSNGNLVGRLWSLSVRKKW